MSALDLHVAGYGLVTPVAWTARHHAFLIRAEAAMHSPRAFLDATGESVEVLHCPTIDPAEPLAIRLQRLGSEALRDALATSGQPARGIRAHVCMAEGLDEPIVATCEEGWSRLGFRFGPRYVGAAGALAALARATDALAQGVPAVMVLAVDSYACPRRLARHLRRTTRWETVPPRLSEGAAALLVAKTGRYGRIRFAATAPGAGSDEDDQPVDGRAMTQLIRQALDRERGPWGNLFGPFAVDSLRRRSWEYGMIRNRHGFALDLETSCLEHSVGRIGAAAGLGHLVYALACQHHDLLAHGGRTATWAVSRDGTRGLAVVAP